MLGTSKVHPILLSKGSRPNPRVLSRQARIGWEVDDVQAEIDDIRARGVPIEEYDIPGLRTDHGIADVGFAWMAWIIDPGKNALAIVQLKERRSG